MATITKFEAQLADSAQNPLIGQAQAHIANAKVDYADDGTANDLDTDARRIAAANATNGTINSILLVLEAHGLVKAS
jgi:hypothetical protein